MNAESAEVYSRCHLPGVAGEDQRIQKALKFAEKDEKLRAKIDSQIAFDKQFTRAIGNIVPPPDLAGRLAACAPTAGQQPFHWRAAIKQPPFWAVVFGLLFLAGWGVYYAWSESQNFPGREAAAQLVAINEQMTGMEMELKTTELGEMGDWLFSKYGFEHFFVPASLANFHTLGGRVFRQGGFQVAQVAVEKNNLICYMFRGEDLGIQLPPNSQWHVFVEEGWAAAIQQNGDTCFMIAFRGNRADMNRFLATLP